MFYSNEEFNAQVQELMDCENYSFGEACGIVQERMEEDEREYNEWRAAEEAVAEREEECRAVTGCDDWYDNQFELDFDTI